MWMGGTVPLGYDVKDRRLVVNTAEAKLVRHIMQRYLDLDSVQELAAELNRDGHRTKLQQGASGPHRGGCPFRRGTLYHLLSNRIYLGDVVHKGVAHRGEHEPIVPKPLWDLVQSTIEARASGGARRRAINPSLLAGLLIDGEERPMTPSHATKGKQRYRYYVTRPDMLDQGPAWRVSAHDLEAIVCARIATLLIDTGALHDLIQAAAGDTQQLLAIIAAGDLVAATLRSGSVHDRLVRITTIAPRVMLDVDRVLITIDPTLLLAALGHPVEDIDIQPIVLTYDAIRTRRGHELRLVIPSPKAPPPPVQRNEKLVALIAEGRVARKMLLDQPNLPLARIAADAGRCRTRLAKLAVIGCLAPDIVMAIVEGRHPATLDHRTLMASDLPLDWGAQRAMFGIG
jgi:site-specific DNA recombinase